MEDSDFIFNGAGVNTSYAAFADGKLDDLQMDVSEADADFAAATGSLQINPSFPVHQPTMVVSVTPVAQTTPVPYQPSMQTGSFNLQMSHLQAMEHAGQNSSRLKNRRPGNLTVFTAGKDRAATEPRSAGAMYLQRPLQQHLPSPHTAPYYNDNSPYSPDFDDTSASPRDPSVPYSPLTPNSISLNSAGTGNAGGPKKIRRAKDRKQHNEEEHRRRTRLRDQFERLRTAANCPKKDRYNILSQAADAIVILNERILQLEREKMEIARQLSMARSGEGGGMNADELFIDQSGAPFVPTRALDIEISNNRSVPCAIVSTEGVILRCNRLLQELVGMPVEIMENSSFFSLAPPEQHKKLCVMFHYLATHERTCWEQEAILQYRNSAVHVHLVAGLVPFRTDRGPEKVVLYLVPKESQKDSRDVFSFASQLPNDAISQFVGRSVNAAHHRRLSTGSDVPFVQQALKVSPSTSLNNLTIQPTAVMMQGPSPHRLSPQAQGMPNLSPLNSSMQPDGMLR